MDLSRLSAADRCVQPGMARPRLPILRWTSLTVLLLVEIIGLSLAFDAGTRSNDTDWAGTVVYASPNLLRAGLVVVLAAGALGLWKHHDDFAVAAASRVSVFWFAMHLATYLLFVYLTDQVLGRDTQEEAISAGAAAIWLATGLLVIATWAATLIRPRHWPGLLWQTRGGLLAGVVIAATALPAAAMARRGWDDLGAPTLWTAARLLGLVVSDVVCHPETRTLGTADFQVIIAPQCSGYDGMGLITVFLVGYLVLCRRELKFPAALVVLPIGVAAAWVLNAVRIAALIWIGDRVSPGLAMSGFHSQAGWLGFGAVAIGLVVALHQTRFLARVPAATQVAPNPTLAYLAPLLVVVLIDTVAMAFLSDPAQAYPLRVIAGAGTLFYFWPNYAVLRQTTPPGYCSTPFGWAVATGAAVYVTWIVLERFGTAGGTSASGINAPTGLPEWAAVPWRMVCAIGFTLVTPVLEELAFRGYFMRRLLSPRFEAVAFDRIPWWSVMGSSVAFGLLHGEWLAATLAGAAYAILVVRTGRLRDAVVAHAVTNALLLMMPGLTS
jgi:exosortase E/protease (VPEID-CTERM system)